MNIFGGVKKLSKLKKVSHLEKEISRLKITAAEAVEHAHNFTDFKKYLHVERPIQREIESVLRNRRNVEAPHLLLLCGSVGDGKSHLLAYLNDSEEQLLSEYKVFNDATESAKPNETALETLEETFKNFSDEHWEETNEKIVIAINLGVLHKFVMEEQKKYTFTRFKEIIKRSGVFDDQLVKHSADRNIDIVSFTHYQMYDLLEDGVQSDYLQDLLGKVCNKDLSNPFYAAYKKDEAEGTQTAVHENFKFLGMKQVQKRVIQVMCRLMIEKKVPISSRHFLDFVADILIPLPEMKGIEKYLPSLLYKNKGRSELLNHVASLHPIHTRLEYIDELMMNLHASGHSKEVVKEYITSKIAQKWIEEAEDKETESEFFYFLVSTLYLTNEAFAEQVEPLAYKEYIYYLYGFNKNERRRVRRFDSFLQKAIVNWQEQPRDGYVYLKRLPYNIGISQKLELSMDVSHLLENRVVEEEGKLRAFQPYVSIVYKDRSGEQLEELRIDYSLYSLLTKVAAGYRPNKKDKEDAVTFVEFLDRLMDFGEKKETLLVNFLEEQKEYELKLESYGEEIYYEFNRRVE